MTPPLVKLTDINVTLGGRHILRNACANVPRGKVTALIGRNGAGKTTLLRTVLGELPYTGQMRFFCGHDHTKPQPEYVGYVPQRLRIDAQFPLTVRDLLAMSLQRRPIILGIARRTEQQMHDLLRRVNASPDYLDMFVDKLSGGQLQRVLLGLALFPSPELLLLDEPTAAIDFADQEAFYHLIRDVNRTTNITVLLISHDLSAVRLCADYVLCMSDGSVQLAGTPHEVLSESNLAGMFAGL